MTSSAFVRGFAAPVTVGLVAGILEPEIPIASEVEGGEHAESPALTF